MTRRTALALMLSPALPPRGRVKTWDIGSTRIRVTLAPNWIARRDDDTITIRGITDGHAEVHAFRATRTSPGGLIHHQWDSHRAEQIRGPISSFALPGSFEVQASCRRADESANGH